MISVDVALFAIGKDALNVLLVNRRKEPYKGYRSLQGGGLYNDETAEEAVKRELNEKLNLTGITPCLAGVFGDPYRDALSHLCSFRDCLFKKTALYKASF